MTPSAGASDTASAATASPSPATATAATAGSATATKAGPGSVAAHPGWTLTFHDEFDGRAGSLPSGKRWVFQTGAGGWGHGELQRYTDRPSNASLDGKGRLVITARKESLKGAQYTSARLTTEGRFSQRYGWFEARLKVPQGVGIWPAFWTNGECPQGWPYCGEIDVMESVGATPTTVHGRVHGPGPHKGRGIGGDWKLDTRIDEDFHVYAIDWQPTYVAFYFDGHEYARVRSDQLPEGDVWAVKHPANLLLNIAVGGAWPGPPDATTHFPQRLVVDWVRVYARD